MLARARRRERGCERSCQPSNDDAICTWRGGAGHVPSRGRASVRREWHTESEGGYGHAMMRVSSDDSSAAVASAAVSRG